MRAIHILGWRIRLIVLSIFCLTIVLMRSTNVSQMKDAQARTPPMASVIILREPEQPRREEAAGVPTAEEIHTVATPEAPMKQVTDDSIGVYLTANSIARSDRFLERTMEKLTAVGGNALVIDVKENEVLYHSRASLATALGTIRPRYDLPAAVLQAKTQGMRVIVRFVAAKDKQLAKKMPETQIIHPETKRSVGSVWVDLANTVTQEYNKELLTELIAAGVDEINIDYIRYPTEYHQNQVGLSVEEKAQHIESFLRMTRDLIDASGKGVKLGISTYAILGWEYEKNLERLGQDVRLFAPLVDIISPMAYPASFAAGAYWTGETGRSRMYELVYKTLTGYQKILGDEAWKLRPWIQGHYAGTKDLQDEIDAVFDAGLCGFTIWSPSNRYEAFYAIRDGVKISPACSNF